MTDFYVYAWLRPCGTPFYIGKGRGIRDCCPKVHNSIFLRIVDKIRASGEEPSVARWVDGIGETDAFKLERSYIKLFGRRNNGTGVLANMTDGGEGAGGAVVGGETRKKLTAALNRRYLDPTARTKTSMQQIKRQEDQSERDRHSFVLLKHYQEHPETRAKLSASHRRRYESIVERDKTAHSSRVRWGDAHGRAQMTSAIRRMPPTKANTSGFKGVSFFSRTSKWVAKIKLDGVSKNLGYYQSPEAAARAYDAAAYKAWGNDCYLNLPEQRMLAWAPEN